MSWMSMYFLSVFLAGAALSIGAWHDLKTNNDSITLGDIFIGIFLSLFPVLNVLIAVFVFMFLVGESSKIVLFGKKDQ